MSVVSTANIIRSLTKECHDIIKDLGRDGLCTLAYDNLDFDFKVKEPTLENPGTFSSITTGTFMTLGHGTMLDVTDAGIMRITYVTLGRFFTPFCAKLSLVQGFWCWPDL